MMDRYFLKLFTTLFFLGMTNFAFAEVHSNVITKEQQSAMTVQEAFKHLKEGNQRFVEGHMRNRDFLSQANASSTSQHPIAVILNCMDARTPPEIVFDQGIGDIFATRVAGNILNDDILGGMEFGTKISGAKLIVVVGHTSCGAVRGACQQVKLGHLTGLLQKIQPAVSEASKQSKSHDCSQADFINQIAKDNVLIVMKQIKARSFVIKQLIAEGKVKIVGGMQDLSTGKVTFFEEANALMFIQKMKLAN